MTKRTSEQALAHGGGETAVESVGEGVMGQIPLSLVVQSTRGTNDINHSERQEKLQTELIWSSLLAAATSTPVALCADHQLDRGATWWPAKCFYS